MECGDAFKSVNADTKCLCTRALFVWVHLMLICIFQSGYCNHKRDNIHFTRDNHLPRWHDLYHSGLCPWVRQPHLDAFNRAVLHLSILSGSATSELNFFLYKCVVMVCHLAAGWTVCSIIILTSILYIWYYPSCFIDNIIYFIVNSFRQSQS